ncbi:MAG TPA: hypothetical protein VF658_05085 [Pyrinomonadaceae bacterium]|jgi:hypothetical protein
MNDIQTRALQSQRLRQAFFIGAVVLSFFVAINILGVARSRNPLSAAQAAQDAITGEWVADFNRKNADEVQFTIMRRSARGGNHSSSDGIRLSEFQGLSREQAFGARADVRFRLVREAGTFEFEGSFREGKGAGHWTLTPNQSFVSAMRSRGYDNLTEDDLFSAALFDINIKSIEDLKAAGYDRLSFKELIEASIFKVTGEFIREMKSAGYDNLTLKELVEARIFKIDSQYVREVQAMGFERQPLKTLVEMRIFKITPEFIREMRSMGFENLSLKQLVEFSIHDVTPEFVNGLKAEGFTSISPKEAVELKIHGVDAAFIRRVKAKGFTDVTLRQLVNLRIHDIVN